MSDLSMYFLAIAKHRYREYLDRAHSIFFSQCEIEQAHRECRLLIRLEIGSNSQSLGSKWGVSMHNNNIIIDLFAAWTQHPTMESLITVFQMRKG